MLYCCFVLPFACFSCVFGCCFFVFAYCAQHNLAGQSRPPVEALTPSASVFVVSACLHVCVCVCALLFCLVLSCLLCLCCAVLSVLSLLTSCLHCTAPFHCSSTFVFILTCLFRFHIVLLLFCFAFVRHRQLLDREAKGPHLRRARAYAHVR